MTTSRHLIALTIAAALLGACTSPARLSSTAEPARPVAATTQSPFASQFTMDGTYQSHQEIDGVDFLYTVYPTKATPRTNDWYARGDKFFTFTFQAYDLDRRLRDRFSTKRRVFLDRIRVSSTTDHPSGTSDSPYRLSGKAARMTFDPEPQKGRYGMLVTSPKGSFELRDQTIGTLAAGTRGVTLTFEATVYIQRSPGSSKYDRETIEETVPIAIFPGTKATVARDQPVDAS